MLTLIKNGEVYSPDYKGKKDVLLAGEKIAGIENHIPVPDEFVDIHVIDASGKIVAPGFIDSHVHITGGGGEAGFASRTPELQLTDATGSGVTTLVGVLGTDGTTRTMTNLIAKAKGLREEGITCYAHTGSYQIPVKTLTGKIEDDIILINEILGAGEIAISDHRSSQPTVDEMARLASEARNGGILAGKAGIVNVHLGDSDDCLTLLEEVVRQTDIPITQFHPTHVNRTRKLFEAGLTYAKNGGYIDFTTSTVPKFLEEGEVKSSEALKKALENGVDIDQITFTSDGQASLPDYDRGGNLIGMQIGKVSSLFEAVQDAVLNQNVEIEKALKVVTANPASLLKLNRKGRLEVGRDSDVVILEKESFTLETVLAMGNVMVAGKVPTVKGTFEN